MYGKTYSWHNQFSEAEQRLIHIEQPKEKPKVSEQNVEQQEISEQGIKKGVEERTKGAESASGKAAKEVDAAAKAIDQADNENKAGKKSAETSENAQLALKIESAIGKAKAKFTESGKKFLELSGDSPEFQELFKGALEENLKNVTVTKGTSFRDSTEFSLKTNKEEIVATIMIRHDGTIKSVTLPDTKGEKTVAKEAKNLASNVRQPTGERLKMFQEWLKDYPDVKVGPIQKTWDDNDNWARPMTGNENVGIYFKGEYLGFLNPNPGQTEYSQGSKKSFFNNLESKFYQLQNLKPQQLGQDTDRVNDKSKKSDVDIAEVKTENSVEQVPSDQIDWSKHVDNRLQPGWVVTKEGGGYYQKFGDVYAGYRKEYPSLKALKDAVAAQGGIHVVTADDMQRIEETKRKQGEQPGSTKVEKSQEAATRKEERETAEGKKITIDGSPVTLIDTTGENVSFSSRGFLTINGKKMYWDSSRAPGQARFNAATETVRAFPGDRGNRYLVIESQDKGTTEKERYYVDRSKPQILMIGVPPAKNEEQPNKGTIDASKQFPVDDAQDLRIWSSLTDERIDQIKATVKERLKLPQEFKDRQIQLKVRRTVNGVNVDVIDKETGKTVGEVSIKADGEISESLRNNSSVPLKF
ncbi:MAG: hypothetical protein WC840_01130 [Candidatus Peribacteraceae bacterium]